jgi:transcriptional regulator with XRE-family HTH domain
MAPTAEVFLSLLIDGFVGRRIRQRRRLLGLTQQQLAIAVGVRFQQIQKYECGANKISVSRLWSLAQALQVQPDYFFEGLAERSPAGLEDARAAHNGPG